MPIINRRNLIIGGAAVLAVGGASYFLTRPQPGPVTGGGKLRVGLAAGDEGTAIKSILSSLDAGSYELSELPYSTLRERLSGSLSRGLDEFDLVMMDDPWFPELAPKLASVEDAAGKLRTDFIPASLKLGMHPYGNGELRAIPYVGNCQLLFSRTDILSSADIQEPPSKWEQLLAAAELGERQSREGGILHSRKNWRTCRQ